MFVILSAIVMAAASPPSAGDMPLLNPNAAQPATCPATLRYEASRRDKKKPQARKLTELPAADAYFAVYRRIGQCEVPMLVKYGVGGR